MQERKANTRDSGQSERKPYTPPKVVEYAHFEGHALTCGTGDPINCTPKPPS